MSRLRNLRSDLASYFGVGKVASPPAEGHRETLTGNVVRILVVLGVAVVLSRLLGLG